MSFLRKRSHSQCSFSKGDDEITVTRIQPDVAEQISPPARAETIRSPRSSRSSWSTCSGVHESDFAIHESCVLRKFPKHKSSHLKFLTWVAYTRKYTDEFISEEERRRCPLLWCREVFKDEDTMLRHVWDCPHLSKGLYYCFHCEKPERVGKSECKKCQGAPSRTDRMASVAKKIFSKLGARPHRKDTIPAVQESVGESSRWMEREVPAYQSHFDVPESFEEVQALEWASQEPQELHNTSILPEMAGEWGAELPNNHISEMVGTECPVELGIGSESWEENFYAETFEDWDPPTVPVKAKPCSPKLAINTAVAPMSSTNTFNNQNQFPISPQTHSSYWENTPLSGPIISPMSPTGGFGYQNFQVSPTDSEASGNTFSSDSGYSTQSSFVISAPNSATREKNETSRDNWLELDPKGYSDNWMSSLAFSKPMVFPPVPAFPIDVRMTTNVCNNNMQSVLQTPVPEKPKLSSPHWNNASSLVQSFSEALDAHILHTNSTLKELPVTSSTAELLALSRTAMTSIGLDVLTGILEGRNPTSMVQISAFTHVACASAIALDHDEAKIYSQAWFQDSLAWAQGLASDRQRQLYTQIARAIWQPIDLTGQNKVSKIRPLREGTNILLSSCKHFLDVFESFGVSGNSPAPQSDFNFTQKIFEHNARARVINELINIPSMEPFREDISRIRERLSRGRITSTRDLELELICAGKLSSQSETAYTRFLHHVTETCNAAYVAEASMSSSRTAHQIHDISEIKTLLPEEIFIEEEPNQQQSRAQHHHDDDLLNFDFDAGDIQACIAAFSKDADAILNQQYDFGNDLLQFPPENGEGSSRSQSVPQQQTHTQPISRTGSLQSSHLRQHMSLPPQPSSYPSTPIQNYHPFQAPPRPSSSLAINPTSTHLPSFTSQPPPPPPPQNPQSSRNPTTNPSPGSKTGQLKCHCGYIPTGKDQWKASNLRRHQRTQHSVGGVVKMYKCQWPGCKGEYGRSDNLKTHMIAKGHGGVGVARGDQERGGTGGGGGREGGMESGGDRVMGRGKKNRKRRKVGAGEERRERGSSRELSAS